MNIEYEINQSQPVENVLILKKYKGSTISQLIVASIFSAGLYFLIGFYIFILSIILLLLAIVIENFPSKYDQIEFTSYGIELLKQKSGDLVEIISLNQLKSFKIEYKQYNHKGYTHFGIELSLILCDDRYLNLDLSNYVLNEWEVVERLSEQLRDYFLQYTGMIDSQVIH
ncbi:hypothetical protein NEF87_004069 [Candidatus Lokiarchaeum ossiferum]|uniref:Uncharacterized protein n=1 Tax=Candidatus Lokiarchaeum ossiferum TaxID=2951803 RepID=A0ABY6HW88_9ARCH|nr:hypothetical protein NEF87_004069 [Candidatus Lokiarchaeum sp. B-35]